VVKNGNYSMNKAESRPEAAFFFKPAREGPVDGRKGQPTQR